MQEGKQIVKMAKGEGKKCPKGSSTGRRQRAPSQWRAQWDKLAQHKSCPAFRTPSRHTHLCVLHLPGQPVLGQVARDLSRRWDIYLHPTANCPEQAAGHWLWGTCSRSCFAHSDKTYIGNKLGGYWPGKHFSGSRRSICWHNLEEDDQMLLPQERWQVKDSKNSRASPAASAAHKLNTAFRHSCHVCLSGLLGYFSRFSLLLHPWIRPCIQSVLWM